MKSFYALLVLLSMAICLAFQGNSEAQPEASEDKTLSPYFFVQSDDPETDRLPLKSTSASVDISGTIADVAVTQVYENTGKNNLEAVYVFPASTRAAVYAMKMTIGERVIVAKIKEKEQARQDYEQAKAEGKSASLLEQHRPNVFQMNVANILPGDVIKVELKYTELLVPTDKVYEFVYPTVVGPRYVGQSAEETPGSETWTANPYLQEGEAPTYGFDIDVDLVAGLALQDIACPSHKTNVQYTGKDAAKITLDSSEKSGGNRDFILKYRLAGDRVDTGMIVSKGGDENFFLLMVQPPDRVKLAQIPPREYIFIVDVSGSMHGFPLDISKELMKNLIGNLRSTDVFNVLLFAGGSSVMAERSLPATEANIEKAIDVIDRQQGGGGTEILPALQRALALPKAEGASRTVVIVTDGYVSVETETFDLIRNKLGEANMFAFGIGSSVNRFIIEGIARVGMGEPYVLTKPAEARAKAEEFRKVIATPVLSNVKVDFGGFEAYDVEPPAIPDVLAERPVIVFGKWRGKAEGKIRVTGKTGGNDFEKIVQIEGVTPGDNQNALRSLWARWRIAVLSDYQNLSPTDDRKKVVTDLGLKYNLLTAYTSFVAIDSEVRAKGQKPTAVKQPLPLPEGVSNLAVGRSYGATARKSLAMPQAMPAAPAPSGRLSLFSKEKKAEDTLAGAAPAEMAEADSESEPMEIDEKSHRVRPFAVEKVTVEAGISEESVRKAVEGARAAMDACLRAAALAGNGARLELSITVGANGELKSVKVLGSVANAQALEKCLETALRNAAFDKPAGASKAEVRVVLKF